MSSQPDERPFSESDLESPEYRKRLVRKLNCLIAVLEVAIAKVRRSLAGPDPDLERLARIQKNLSETLEVCRRAKRALELHEQLPDDLSHSLSNVLGKGARQDAARELAREPRTGKAVEMSSPEELERFENLEPIDTRAIRSVDLEELARLLQG